MNINVNRQFILLDFELIDDPKFLEFVSASEFGTYLILRRFIWRGGENKPHFLNLHTLYENNKLLVCKRSQECHEGTNLAHMGRKADHAHIAVGASVVATHLITSSAWKRRVGGIVSPRAWAVLRLMISSNFIGCNTGRSAGLAPFRSLST
jgi:hypothetical protein